MMINPTPIDLAYIICSILYLLLFIVVIYKRGFKDRIGRGLLAFLGVSMITSAVHLFLTMELIPQQGSWELDQIDGYSLILQLAFLHNLSLHYFQRRAHWYRWIMIVFTFSILFVLDYTQFTKPYFIQLGQAWMLTGKTLITLSIWIVWGVYFLRLVWRTLQTYIKDELLIRKSRLRYWLFALILILIGDIAVFLNQEIYGQILKMGAGILVTYVVISTRLPNLMGILKQLLIWLLSTFLILFALSICLYFIFINVKEVFQLHPILLSVGLSIVILFILIPLHRVINSFITRVFLGRRKDYDLLFREYGKKIGNILELDLLPKVIVELIGEWVDVERGTLFMVDSEASKSSGRGYQLVDVKGKKRSQTPPGFLSMDSPLTLVFREEKKPVTLNDILLLSEYQNVFEQERIWFSRLRYDIFIPIFGMDEWIGLLALGPSKSKKPYTKSDIRFLETIADQTSVVLQNARLMESIVRVNREFKRAYSAMEEAHTKLEYLDRTKSDFISISSHELRTPLTVISGYSEMLLEDPRFVESEYYYKAIKGIHDATSRLGEIIDSMLEMARIDTKQLELQSESVSIFSLIHKVAKTFNDIAGKRNLTLSFENLEKLPPVEGDGEALEKVFYHLLSNAFKYTPDGGNIQISGVAVPEGDLRYKPGGVEILIKDSGIGIDPRYQDLIFTKFYQTGELSLHSTGKMKFKGGGPGLGLAIVKGIVLAHGGRVWVESPGSDEDNFPGSTFHVILPSKL